MLLIRFTYKVGLGIECEDEQKLQHLLNAEIPMTKKLLNHYRDENKSLITTHIPVTQEILCVTEESGL